MTWPMAVHWSMASATSSMTSATSSSTSMATCWRSSWTLPAFSASSEASSPTTSLNFGVASAITSQTFSAVSTKMASLDTLTFKKASSYPWPAWVRCNSPTKPSSTCSSVRVFLPKMVYPSFTTNSTTSPATYSRSSVSNSKSKPTMPSAVHAFAVTTGVDALVLGLPAICTSTLTSDLRLATSATRRPRAPMIKTLTRCVGVGFVSAVCTVDNKVIWAGSTVSSKGKGAMGKVASAMRLLEVQPMLARNKCRQRVGRS
mmetsp:Transcript_35638/g.90635  ORF Transcript_35638/g.90635 Transcript_35638/m.90635 type:complete len:259 (-) Transcript_35638:18-794(-)